MWSKKQVREAGKDRRLDPVGRLKLAGGGIDEGQTEEDYCREAGEAERGRRGLEGMKKSSREEVSESRQRSTEPYRRCRVSSS